MFLVNTETKSVALVYRAKQNDYSFPKGHKEDDETLEQCAIRKTAEETKRVAEIVNEFEPNIERYTTPRGENCACYMYIAVDKGECDNTCEDTHDTYWIPFEDVEEKLSYPNLNVVKDKILTLLK